MNNIACIFSISNRQAFFFAQFAFSVTHLSNRCVQSPTSSPSAPHATSSTKDIPSLPHSSSFFSTWPNNPKRYITTTTGDTGDPCGTPGPTSILSPPFPSIDKITFLPSVKLSSHLTRSASNPISSIPFIKFPFATCGKAPLTSINSTAAVFPIPHASKFRGDAPNTQPWMFGVELTLQPFDTFRYPPRGIMTEVSLLCWYNSWVSTHCALLCLHMFTGWHKFRCFFVGAEPPQHCLRLSCSR